MIKNMDENKRFFVYTVGIVFTVVLSMLLMFAVLKGF